MNLTASIQSESLKLKRTASLYLCFIAAAFLPILLFFETMDLPPTTKSLPWNLFFLERNQVINFVFLPLYIILASTLLMQTEYRDKTWKQVLTSPQRLSSIFLAKFIMLQALILLFLLTYNIGLSVVAIAINLLRPQMYNGGLQAEKILTVNVQTYLLILNVSAIQFWLALRFKNFIVPLAIGFCLWFIAPLMVFELHLKYAEFYPYAYSILTQLPKYKDKIVTYQWLSVANCILFLTIGFIEFQNRKVRV